MADVTTIAEQVEAEKAARASSDARLLKWLRRQVNADLRRWRPVSREEGPARAGAAERVADCKAKLALLDWAGRWQRVREPGYTSDERVRDGLEDDLAMIMRAVRYIAMAYRSRDGWRDEWEARR